MTQFRIWKGICNGQGTVALRRTDFQLWRGSRDLVPLPTKAQRICEAEAVNQLNTRQTACVQEKQANSYTHFSLSQIVG